VLDASVTLTAAFDRVAAVQPASARRLGPLAADHRAHAAELARMIGTAAPSAPAATPSAATIQDLRTAVRAAWRTADAACRQAPPERAAMLGSIAACRASHIEALR
jgi:hypothetical protein